MHLCWYTCRFDFTTNRWFGKIYLLWFLLLGHWHADKSLRSVSLQIGCDQRHPVPGAFARCKCENRVWDEFPFYNGNEFVLRISLFQFPRHAASVILHTMFGLIGNCSQFRVLAICGQVVQNCYHLHQFRNGKIMFRARKSEHYVAEHYIVPPQKSSHHVYLRSRLPDLLAVRQMINAKKIIPIVQLVFHTECIILHWESGTKVTTWSVSKPELNVIHKPSY